MDYTILNYYGKQESKCGYCKGTNCSQAHGMHAYNLMPEDYQDLIDRGWRRSGNYCYKPLQTETCCPCYPIRCNALNFKLSKSHKKILKRMSRFLRDGKKDKNEEAAAHQSIGSSNVEDDCASSNFGIHDEPKAPNVPIPEVNLAAITTARNHSTRPSASKVRLDTLQIADMSASEGSKKSFDGNNPPCKKAKQMRQARKLAKLEAKGLDMKDSEVARKNQEKTLADFIGETSPHDKHKLKIVLVASNDTSPTDEAFNLYRKYQLCIHNDSPQRLTPKNLQRFCYKSPLKLHVLHVKSKEFSKTLEHTYALYQKYQAHIHNDPPKNVREYLEFLQCSPLQLITTEETPAAGYGSFHQQYWLDDKLIAVGVIDVLPYCVSSVYFFYDPDYSFLSLGTYGSLREIDLVQQLAETAPACHYYYMGFYIHSCPKMRYKGKLVPSYLLCPETYTWNLLTDDMRAALDVHKYQRFNADAAAHDVDEFLENHLDEVKLLVESNTLITYSAYKEITGSEEERDMILEYGKLVGKTCAHRMLYLLNIM